MNKKTLYWSVLASLLVGFVAGSISYPIVHSTAFAQNQKEKKKKDPVVRELGNIKKAIADRNSPVVHELENIEEAISDRNSPVVRKLENISNELEEISEMNRTLEEIERHLD